MSKKSPSGFGETTSHHVQRAVTGDATSVEWLVRRFSPLLLVQARRRLSPLAPIDAEDLVQDVWVRGLRTLPKLSPYEGHYAEAVIRSLGTILWRRNRDVMAHPANAGPIDLVDVPSPLRGPLKDAIAKEEVRTVTEAIRKLDDLDQEILLDRLVDNATFAQIGAAVGMTENTATKRFHRALDRLKEQLKGSIFDEFAVEREA